MHRDARTNGPDAETLTVAEATQLRVIESSNCPTCGSAPSAGAAFTPAPEDAETGTRCMTCGSAVTLAAQPTPLMRPSDIWRDYAAPPDAVRKELEACISALGFAHDPAASDDQLVAFRTGMSLRAYGLNMGAHLYHYGDRTRVLIKGRLRGPQVYGWGAVEDAGRRVFHEMNRSQPWADRVLDGNLRDPRRLWMNLGSIVLMLLIWGGIIWMQL